MSTETMLRWFFAGVFSLIVTVILFFRTDKENNLDTADDKPRYLPLFPSQLLPGVLLTMTLLFLWEAGPAKTFEAMLSICFPIFLQICFYQLVLLLLLPLLRKWFSARACAALWLLPNYLYLTQYGVLLTPEPIWVWHVPRTAVTVGFFIWLTGMAAILLWYIVRHLLFRRSLLRSSRPVTDPAILNQWQSAQQRAKVRKPDYKLLISPHIATPLSIGLFRRTIRVILPERSYTEEDLQLVFRHELVHIGREDSSAKFFLAFCTAMCWFNPLMWIAMARSAEDMELSCDETVLLGCDTATRRRYADLLLRTAGEARGFTTCLSASANAMRHRLQHVIKPKKRLTGALLIGLCFFLLLLSCGHIALAYEVGHGETLIFENQSLDTFRINSISCRENRGYTLYECTDSEAVLQYFSNLSLTKRTGSYVQSDEADLIMVLLQGKDGVIGLNLTENSLRVSRLYEDPLQSTVYHLAQSADLQAFRQYLRPATTVNVSYVEAPDLMLYFNEDINPTGELMYTWKQIDKKIENGEITANGIRHTEGVGGVYGQLPQQVELIFSMEPAEDFTIVISDWEDANEQVIRSSELEHTFVLPLADYSAHYTVFAAFEPQENLRFEMVYRFDICLETE